MPIFWPHRQQSATAPQHTPMTSSPRSAVPSPSHSPCDLPQTPTIPGNHGQSDVEEEVHLNVEETSGGHATVLPQNTRATTTSQPLAGDALQFLATGENNLLSLQTVASRLAKELGKINNAREKVSRLEFDVHHNIEACRYAYRYLKASQSELDQKVTSLLAPSTNFSDTTLSDGYSVPCQDPLSSCQKTSPVANLTIEVAGQTFYERHSEYEQDRRDLDRRWEETQAIGEDLSEAQDYLRKKENAFQSDARELLSLLEQIGLPGCEEADPDESSDHGSQRSLSIRLPEPEVHPQAQAYYDASGYVSILHERLMMLRTEYDEKRGYRALRADRDEALSISDGSFERSYEEQFLEAKQQLDSAVVEEGAAREAYLALTGDLDVEPDAIALQQERSIKDVSRWAKDNNPDQDYADFDFPQDFEANPSERVLHRSRHSVPDLVHLPQTKVQPESWPWEVPEQRLREMQLHSISAPNISDTAAGDLWSKPIRRILSFTSLRDASLPPSRHDSGHEWLNLPRQPK